MKEVFAVVSPVPEEATVNVAAGPVTVVLVDVIVMADVVRVVALVADVTENIPEASDAKLVLETVAPANA